MFIFKGKQNLQFSKIFSSDFREKNHSLGYRAYIFSKSACFFRVFSSWRAPKTGS